VGDVVNVNILINESTAVEIPPTLGMLINPFILACSHTPNSIGITTEPPKGQYCGPRRTAAPVANGKTKVVATVGSGTVGCPWMVTGLVSGSTASDPVAAESVAFREDCWSTILLGMGARVKPLLEHVEV
jgi:hypothetical protein